MAEELRLIYDRYTGAWDVVDKDGNLVLNEPTFQCAYCLKVFKGRGRSAEGLKAEPIFGNRCCDRCYDKYKSDSGVSRKEVRK